VAVFVFMEITLQVPKALGISWPGKSYVIFNRLTPNDPYSGRTAPITSKVAFYIFIQQI